MEETLVTDPASGMKIRVSVTTRKMYRHIFRNSKIGMMRNEPLNQLIANDFSKSSDKVVHSFKLGKSGEAERSLAEIRNRAGSVMFFISTVRGQYVDILTLQSAWKSPKYTARYGVRKGKE